MKCNHKKPVITLYSGEKLCKDCFLKYFEKKVRKTIRKYKLIDKKEKLLVAVSGGKDSTVVLYLLNKIIENKKIKIEAYHVDQGLGTYSKKNLKNVTDFCKKIKITLHKTTFRKEFGYSVCYIRDILKEKGHNIKSCTICGVLRRYLINKEARKLKATKLVTGHNLDDEAQNVIMNIFRNSINILPRLGPKTGLLEHKKFIPRIKPLYFCFEEEVKLYSKLMKFNLVYEDCPCSVDSYRKSVKHMLNDFEKKYKGTKNSIISSFLGLLPTLKKGSSKEELKFCSKCKEVSMDKLCAACKILEKLKN